MAQFVTRIRTNLQGSLNKQTIGGKMFTQDNKANRIEVALYNNNVPVAAEGEIDGIVLRSDGTTVAFHGAIDDSEGTPIAYVELPEIAYAVAGPISILIRETLNKNTANEKKTVVAICDAYVLKSSTDDYITPEGTVIKSTDDLIALVSQLEATVNTAAAVIESLNPSVNNATHTLFIS